MVLIVKSDMNEHISYGLRNTTTSSKKIEGHDVDFFEYKAMRNGKDEVLYFGWHCDDYQIGDFVTLAIYKGSVDDETTRRDIASVLENQAKRSIVHASE